MKKSIRVLSFIFIIIVILIAVPVGYYGVYYQYYTTSPQCVFQTQVADCPEFIFFNDKIIYRGEALTDFMRNNKLSPSIPAVFKLLQRQFYPLAIKGRTLESISSDLGTHHTALAFKDADSSQIYFYWVDERFNNFFLGLTL